MMLRKLMSRIGRKLQSRMGSYSLESVCSSPSTSPVVNDEKCFQWSDGVTIEAFCPSTVQTNQLFETQDCDQLDLTQTADLWTHLFGRHLSGTHEFALQDVESTADAREVYDELENTRRILERMITHYASRHGDQIDGSAILVNAVFRSFYDFVFKSMHHLETRYPNLHEYVQRNERFESPISKLRRFRIEVPQVHGFAAPTKESNSTADSDFFSLTTDEFEENTNYHVEYLV